MVLQDWIQVGEACYLGQAQLVCWCPVLRACQRQHLHQYPASTTLTLQQCRASHASEHDLLNGRKRLPLQRWPLRPLQRPEVRRPLQLWLRHLHLCLAGAQGVLQLPGTLWAPWMHAWRRWSHKQPPLPQTEVPCRSKWVRWSHSGSARWRPVGRLPCAVPALRGVPHPGQGGARPRGGHPQPLGPISPLG